MTLSNKASSPEPQIPAQTPPRRLTEAGIGLGSNLYDRLENLKRACRMLCEIKGACLVSAGAVYETEPVGVPPEYADLRFLNTVLIFNVALDVDDWSAQVHAVEDKMLRVRGPVRNAPRIIDLDLLYFGDTVRSQPHLNLPHPQCTSRRFVCAPLADVRPNLILPGQTSTVAEILARMDESPQVVFYAPPLTTLSDTHLA